MIIKSKNGRLSEVDNNGKLIKLQCTKCKEMFQADRDNFYWDSTKNKFYTRCKKCHIEVKEKWRKKNMDKSREYMKKYYWNNADKCREWKRNYDKSYVGRNYKRQYRLKNRDYINRKLRYRSIKVSRMINDFTEDQWEQCKEYFNNKCAYCGKEEKLTKDHFIPVRYGGGTTLKNILPCCMSCNGSKQQKSFIEWYQIQPFYDTNRLRKIMEYIR